VVINPKNVLIVDDDLADVYLLHKTLLQCGCKTVESVASGADAAKYIAGLVPFAHRHLPNLIFLDLNMAGIDGFQLMAWLKGNLCYTDIPVIIFSGSTNPADKIRAMQLGATAYFEKTQEADKLRAIVEDVLKFDHPVETSLSKRSR
jgi:CheY-like chemotaxis protein